MVQFLRSGQHDDRRRRVLTEEVIGSASGGEADAQRASGKARRASQAARRYPEATLEERQPRLADLVPRSYTVAVLLFALGAAIVAGLEGLYHAMPRLSPPQSGGRLAAFDLAAAGSVAAWFSSTTLALCGAAAIVVYTIRRHRLDDYHGRYRVWLWTAGCAWLLSVDEAASLHEAFSAWMVHASGRELLAGGAAWWIGLYGLIAGAVGLRLTLELRECRASTAALALAGVCYAAAIAMRLDWLAPAAATHRVMVKEGCEMTGNLWLLLAIALYARHVIHDAEGLLPIPAEKKPRPASKRRRWWGRTIKIDAAHATPKPPTKRSDLMPVERVPAVPMSKAAAELAREEPDDPRVASERRPLSRKLAARYRDDGDEEEDIGGRKLSKAERKALRRQKERHRHGEMD
jgi:hypothetical protein